MATSRSEWIGKGVLRHTIGLHGAENSDRFDAGKLSDKSVHVTTTGGSTITIQGNNSTGTAGWVGLVDPQGNAVTFAANGIEQLLENPRFIRARSSGGATTDTSEVIFLCR